MFQVTWFKISLTAALAIALGAPAASAAVGDATFDAFQKACGDTHGDYVAVSAAATADDWKPSALTAPPMSGVTFSGQLSRVKTADGGQITLIAAQGKTGSGINVSVCTVYGPTQGFEEMRTRAGKWLGFPAHDSDAQKTTYHYTSAGGTLKPVADADADTTAAGAGLYIFTVKMDSGKAILDFINIKK